jgi:cystathionine beta-lyase
MGGCHMKYNFDEIINRRGTYSLKWDGGEWIKEIGLTERYDEETLPLFTADMDLPVPEPLIKALHKTVDHRIFGYSVIPDEYHQAIQACLKKDMVGRSRRKKSFIVQELSML